MKIDLHVHTSHSQRPAIWLLQKLGCPESFTDPHHCHGILKQRGMGLVTFTDHNSIKGCLEIAHLPDTFISEEVTAYFPEDRCKIHVLAYGITESDHAVIQKKRDNIYHLVDYFRGRNIAHAIAHPLSAVNDRFTWRHFEKLLLLFNVFEINGDQVQSVNAMLSGILSSLTEEKLHILSRRHGLTAFGAAPWRKRLVSGSDDHAGLRPGDSCTEVENAENAEEFFRAVDAGRAATGTTPATELTFARDIYSVAYRYGKERFGLEAYSGVHVLLRFCDAMLHPHARKSAGLLAKIGHGIHKKLRRSGPADAAASLTDFVSRHAERLIRRTPELRAFLETPAASGTGAEAWFDFVGKVADITTADLAGTFMKRLREGRYFNLFHLLGSAGSLYTLLAPYLVSFSFCAAERRLADGIFRRFFPGAPGAALKIACLTDTFHEPNAVAGGLRRRLENALASGRGMRVVTASGREGGCPGVHVLPSAYLWEVPDRSDVRLSVPAFLPLLRHISEEGYTCLQAATIGPAGLSALLAGRLLRMPVAVSYHSGLFEYLRTITDDNSMTELLWLYVVWFCNQCDRVLTENEEELEELAARGVAREKILSCPAGADPGEVFDRHWEGLLRLLEERRRANAGQDAGDEMPMRRREKPDRPEFLFGESVVEDFLRSRSAGTL